jgi:hypothetical protein
VSDPWVEAAVAKLKTVTPPKEITTTLVDFGWSFSRKMENRAGYRPISERQASFLDSLFRMRARVKFGQKMLMELHAVNKWLESLEDPVLLTFRTGHYVFNPVLRGKKKPEHVDPLVMDYRLTSADGMFLINVLMEM